MCRVVYRHGKAGEVRFGEASSVWVRCVMVWQVRLVLACWDLVCCGASRCGRVRQASLGTLCLVKVRSGR